MRVRRLEAHMGDAAALGRLLAALPEGEELRPRLTTPFFARAWDSGLLRDLWIASDGSHVSCYVISGLTLGQAAAVRVRWDARKSRRAGNGAASVLNVDALADVVAATVKSSVTVVE